MKLDQTQFKKFLQLIVERQAYSFFEIYLGLSRSEVEALKNDLEIDSEETARQMLNNEVEYERRYQEARQSLARREAKEQHKLAEIRLKKQELDKQEKQKKLVKKKLNKDKLKKEDAKRQKKFVKSQEKKVIKKSSWQLPNDEDPLTFSRLLTTRGWSFVRDKYNVTSTDIINEVNRLKLKVDFDLIPR